MIDGSAAIVRAAVLALCLAASAAGLWADAITFSAQKVKSVYAAGRESTQLSGAARINTGDITIESDSIELFGAKQRYIECKSPVAIHDAKRNIDLRGDALFYDRDSDILKVTGNAQLEDYKNDMLVRGGMIESRNKDNVAIVQVGVRVFKKDIAARSEMLVYRRDEDKVELSGLPVVYKKKDEYRASVIGIDLKTEEIQMTGRVQGSVQAGKPVRTESASGTPAGGDPAGGGAPKADGKAVEAKPAPGGKP